MIRTLTLSATLLAPTYAVAHNDGHAEMSITTELAHMLSDPLHLGLIAAVIVAGAVIWKSLATAKSKQTQD